MPADALAGLIVENPAISHLRLVECYAAGPKAIRRAEEITRSFTIFLEEGYRYRAQAASLPRLCSEAVTGAIFEIVQRDIADGQLAQLAAPAPAHLHRDRTVHRDARGDRAGGRDRRLGYQLGHAELVPVPARAL
jgi:hypothetical protein